MIVLIILSHLTIGAIELYLWKEHPFMETLLYLLLLLGTTIFAVMLAINPELPVPSFFNGLAKLWEKLLVWRGSL